MKYIALAAAVIGVAFAAPSAVAAPSATPPSVRSEHPSAPPPPSAPASTAEVTPATSYNGACGSGYSQIDSLTLTDMGVELGKVYLTYNSATGNNCAVTVRANPGVAMDMTVGIEFADGTHEVFDHGYYTTYAGPVYLHAPGQCITWFGGIGKSLGVQSDSHCG